MAKTMLLVLYVAAVGFWLTACSGMKPHLLREMKDGEKSMQDGSSFEKTLNAAVQAAEKRHGCRIAVSLRDPLLEGGAYSYRGGELFHAASTMKVPVMIEVFRQADAGELSTSDTMKLDPVFRSMIDDSPYEVEAAKYLKKRPDEDVTILELVEQMIVVSDNLATNLLLTRARTQRVTAMMRHFGIEDGYVLRCLMDIPAYEAGVSNRMTADGLTRMMELIDTRQAASPASCEEMIRILEAQEYRDFIPAGVPPGIRVGNKTGTITANAHDTAIVWSPEGTYYLTIMTDGLRDKNDGAQIIAPISRLIFEERLRLAAKSPQPQ